MYAEVPAGSLRADAAVTVVDLSAVVLATLALILFAYLRAGGPATERAQATGTATDGPCCTRAQALPVDRNADTALLPLRDLDDALRITGGSLDIADAMLEQMLAELPALIGGLTTAAGVGDWTEARRAAGEIMGATGACAVPALHAAVRRLQTATDRQDAGAVAGARAAIELEHRRLIGAGRAAGPAATPLRAGTA